MVKNQEWFDSYYRNKEKEEKIDFGDLGYEEFQGQLYIENYPKLKEIYLFRIDRIDNMVLKNLGQLRECVIWDCGISNLVIENCPKIKKLHVRDNLLTSLNFLKSLENSEELDLDISLNNFSENELEPLRNITKLCKLNVGNSFRGKVLLNRYNRFYGSLMYFTGKNNLTSLDISNTNIDKGLRKLPKSLKEIACSNDFLIYLIKGNKCSRIVQELKDYRIGGDRYDLDLWRKSHMSIEEQIVDSIIKEKKEEPENLKKTILFLGAKKTFAETRQNTVNNLIDIYNGVNKSGKKFEKAKKTGDAINEVGGIIPGVGTVTKTVGKGISMSANFFKQRFLKEQAQTFEDYLIGDEKALESLKETCQSLENSFQNNQNKLPTVANLLNLNRDRFGKHSVFKIGDIKPNESPTTDKMSQVIEALNKHLKEFIQALQQEAEQCDGEIKLLTETNGELPNEIERLLNELFGGSEQSQQQAQIKDLSKDEVKTLQEIPPKK